MDVPRLLGGGVVRNLVATVVDPEIPALTIEDLGILRDVTATEHGVRVVITPTYSGCPAMRQIEDDIRLALAGHGEVEIVTVFSPAWTTDWMSEEGKRRLAESGIAPPGQTPLCPKCGGDESRVISRFGSTACKALLVCASCGEPFDLFKELT